MEVGEGSGGRFQGRRFIPPVRALLCKDFLYGEETTQAQILRPASDRSPKYRRTVPV